jgi:hypothetical protein
MSVRRESKLLNSFLLILHVESVLYTIPVLCVVVRSWQVVPLEQLTPFSSFCFVASSASREELLLHILLLSSTELFFGSSSIGAM